MLSSKSTVLEPVDEWQASRQGVPTTLCPNPLRETVAPHDGGFRSALFAGAVGDMVGDPFNE